VVATKQQQSREAPNKTPGETHRDHVMSSKHTPNGDGDAGWLAPKTNTVHAVLLGEENGNARHHETQHQYTTQHQNTSTQTWFRISSNAAVAVSSIAPMSASSLGDDEPTTTPPRPLPPPYSCSPPPPRPDKSADICEIGSSSKINELQTECFLPLKQQSTTFYLGACGCLTQRAAVLSKKLGMMNLGSL